MKELKIKIKMKSVKIGNQEWTAENMAVTVDRYGNELELGKDYFYPDGNVNNVEKYGLLYTWEAANRIAPEGWHLPTSEEWKELYGYCTKQYAVGDSKINIAKALASTDSWIRSEYPYTVGNNSSGNNATGFNVLPAGYYHDVDYHDVSYSASFWSATSGNNYEALYCYFYYCEEQVQCGCIDKDYGFSVRLVKTKCEKHYQNFTLTLHLKKKWFDMIKSGEKKEEYREISEYWKKRLCENYKTMFCWLASGQCKQGCCTNFKTFDKIEFAMGYPKKNDTTKRIAFENPKIEIRTGKEEWGAEKDKKYFVITWEGV